VVDDFIVVDAAALILDPGDDPDEVEEIQRQDFLCSRFSRA